MQYYMAKYLLISILGAFIFSFPVYQSASETVNTSNLDNQMGSGSVVEGNQAEFSNHQTSTTVTFKSRAEIYEVILGTFMIILGLFALALALYRWNPKDLSLIAFGAFCFIYGARSSAIQFLLDTTHTFWAYWRWFLSYLTPVPVWIFFEQILCGNLENDFVTAGYLLIDTEKQTATYAGAGHPPLLLWRRAEQKIYEYRKNGVVLGQLEDAQYNNVQFNLTSGDRCILYTDGIIEATNATGDFFGWKRFKKFITDHGDLSVGNFADRLIQHISDWSGKHVDEALDDDITLVVADFTP
jgi:hypothetical protein